MTYTTVLVAGSILLLLTFAWLLLSPPIVQPDIIGNRIAKMNNADEEIGIAAAAAVAARNEAHRAVMRLHSAHGSENIDLMLHPSSEAHTAREAVHVMGEKLEALRTAMRKHMHDGLPFAIVASAAERGGIDWDAVFDEDGVNWHGFLHADTP